MALQPSPEAVADLDGFLDPRRDAAPFRWAVPEQFHVTLAFLAEVPDRCLDDLVERLARAAKRRTSFSTRVTGGGAFPNPARACVLWAGLDLDETGATELDQMATGARAAAGKAGVAVDGQRFRPHVTLARLARPTEISRWGSPPRKAPVGPGESVRFVADNLVAVRIVTTPSRETPVRMAESLVGFGG